MGVYDDPAPNFAAITPHDTNELPSRTRGIYCGGGDGDVVVKDEDGNTVTFVGPPAGMILPVRTKIVTTGTTCSSLVALW